jgi:hypothetical protein
MGQIGAYILVYCGKWRLLKKSSKEHQPQEMCLKKKGKFQTCPKRHVAAGSRQQAAGSRQQAAGSRQQAVAGGGWWCLGTGRPTGATVPHPQTHTRIYLFIFVKFKSNKKIYTGKQTVHDQYGNNEHEIHCELWPSKEKFQEEEEV